MAEPDLYDEFGNYVGPDLGDESEEEEEEEEEEEWGDEAMEDEDDGLTTMEGEDELKMEVVEYDASKSMAVTLHEDKQYYPVRFYGAFFFLSLSSSSVFHDPP